ncbi:MAG: class I SAM-dependent methyltransferase [Planctomycetes bacterium]|nr:class I SAM-dependent methyltransferase [Planctomycetota bacterium]
MRENTYDDENFFSQYSQMDRSVKGLEGAGEWHAFRKMFPPLTGKRVLDLGCGFGWHCRYAVENGAASAVGVDLSANMIAGARERTREPNITYVQAAIEDVRYPADSFDLVVSSLALHYVMDYRDVYASVWSMLAPGGDFVLSVEHPIFTAEGSQAWVTDKDGAIRHWPVDRYFEEGVREAVFLGVTVTKYHRTVASYIGGLLDAGFVLTGVVEPEPDPALLDTVPGMRDELRRPMMLLLSAHKPE